MPTFSSMSENLNLPEEREFVCRGKEGGTVLHYDHPRNASLHLLRLFVIGTPPSAPDFSLQDVIEWDAHPLRSYVADGTGGLSVVAHPTYGQKNNIGALRGLTGLELAHCGDCGFADRLWDELQLERFAAGEPPLWGFGGDDTHLIEEGRCGLSWVAVKIRRRNTVELKRSMRGGAVYPSNGMTISDFHVDGSTVTVTCDRPVEVRWMAAGQYYDGLGLEVRHRYPEKRDMPPGGEARRLIDPAVGFDMGANHCLAVDRDATESTFTVSAEIARRTPYIRCAVLDPDDLAVMRRMLEEGRPMEEIAAAEITIRKAFSMPFIIRADGSVQSPYPTEGEWVRAMTHNHADLPADRLEGAVDFHAAYRRLGIEASFETGYCYWFFPYLHYPPDATPIIRSVSPDRAAPGEEGRIEIRGDNLPSTPRVFIGNAEAEDVESSGGIIVARVPDGLAIGVHDVTVRDPQTPYQDTRPDAFAVQRLGARNDGWTRFSLEAGLPDEHVYFVGRADGTLYAGTRNGLAIFDGEGFAHIGGGPVNAEAIALAPNGRLWASGWDGVHSREPDGGWRRWDEGDGLIGFANRSASFHHIIRTKSGEILVSHYRPGRVSVLDGNRWREELTLTGGRHNAVTFLAESPDGRLYSGSLGHGVLERCADGWRQAESIPQPPARAPRRIYFDRAGRMVLACAENDPDAPGGIQILEDGRWRVIGKAEGLPDNRVWALAFAGGAIWAATTRGVARVDSNGYVEAFDMLNSGLPHDMVTDMFADNDGAIWIASGRGAARYYPRESD